MKRTIYLLTTVLIIAGIFTACQSEPDNKKGAETERVKQLWTCGMHPEVILDEPGQCPKCGMNLTPMKKTGQRNSGTEKQKGDRKILYWQAPMNPTEIYDKPGKSKMGMDLIAVYTDQISSGAGVQIDPVTVQNMGVRMAPVERVDFTRNLRTVGRVDYNEEKIYVVSSKISGWIEKLFVSYTGENVRKGQTLLEIYSPQLVTTQQEYLLAIENHKLIGKSKFAGIRAGAESLVKSSKRRLEYWDIPEKEIEKLASTGQVRKTLTLQSPANGVVVQKYVEEGMHIKAGTALYRIADLSTIWIIAGIYDNEAPWVHIGQKAEIELSYAPGEIFEGRISYIYPYLNKKTRDLQVRIEFPNPGFKLKPGMYANVRIQTSVIKDAIVVPAEAVIRSGRRSIVFISRGNGRFEPREVVPGEESDNGQTRIKSGLLGTEKIVISAQFMLDSESRLQEAIQKMLAEKSVAKSSKKSSVKMEEADNQHEHSRRDRADEEMGGNHERMDTNISSGQPSKKPDKKSNKETGKEAKMKCAAGKCGGN